MKCCLKALHSACVPNSDLSRGVLHHGPLLSVFITVVFSSRGKHVFPIAMTSMPVYSVIFLGFPGVLQWAG